MADFGFNLSDIQKYENVSGLGSSVPVTAILLDGADGSVQPSGPPPYNNGSSSEVAMDIELIIAMAPGLSQVRVYQGNPFSSPNGLGQNVYPDDLMASIADDDAAPIVNCSLGFFAETTTAFILQQMAAQGQSFFESSGDFGAYFSTLCNPICHSIQDEVYITSVGATDLNTNPDGTWASEDANPASGGGYSFDLPLPLFQQGAINGNNKGSTTARNFPDVAANGNINNYVVFTDITGPSPVPGQTMNIGGTSAACPLWAGFMALVNQQRAMNNKPSIGFADTLLYAIGKGPNYHNDFHDITVGNNTNGTVSYNAVPNYDLVTGWGSPAGQPLINDLCPGCTPAPPAPTATLAPTKAMSPAPSGPPFETRTFTPTATPSPTLTCVPNGALWKEITKKAAFLGRADFASVVYKGRMWIFGGETLNPGGTVYDTTADDAWSSPDGANWTPATGDAGLKHRMSSKLAVFDPQDGQGPRMYLYGGFDPFSTPPNKIYNDLYTSFDGMTWTIVPGKLPPVRIAPVFIAFNGRLWLAGGGGMDDEWSTADGVHWVQNMAHIQALGNGFHTPPNSPTQDFANVSDAVVLNGRIWAMAQSNSSPHPNCLFYTPDGYTWTYVPTGNFQNRDNFAFFSYAGLLWIAGGSKGTQRFNDVWYVDPASLWNWKSATMKAPFSPRGLFEGGLVFQDQMWILGGALAPAKPGGATGFGNDVWETLCP